MWKHKKYKSLFVGSYKNTDADRVFTLTFNQKAISYESWQAAKKDGWVKVK